MENRRRKGSSVEGFGEVLIFTTVFLINEVNINFNLIYSMGWCSAAKDETMENHIKTGVHSPARFRVLGSLANTPEFGAAWGCKIGDPMRPRGEKMCKVW